MPLTDIYAKNAGMPKRMKSITETAWLKWTEADIKGELLWDIFIVDQTLYVKAVVIPMPQNINAHLDGADQLRYARIAGASTKVSGDSFMSMPDVKLIARSITKKQSMKPRY